MLFGFGQAVRAPSGGVAQIVEPPIYRGLVEDLLASAQPGHDAFANHFLNNRVALTPKNHTLPQLPPKKLQK